MDGRDMDERSEHHPLSFVALRDDVKARPGVYVLFILSMNIIGTSGTVSIWDADGEFATMVWLRIWLVSLPANVVFVWGTAMTLRCLFLLVEVPWTKRFMFYVAPWLVAPVLIALSWIASWNVLAISDNVDIMSDNGGFLDFSWFVTFVTSIPMDYNDEYASLVMWSWVSLPFATGVAAMMAYAAGERHQKAQDSSTS